MLGSTRLAAEITIKPLQTLITHASYTTLTQTFYVIHLVASVASVASVDILEKLIQIDLCCYL